MQLSGAAADCMQGAQLVHVRLGAAPLRSSQLVLGGLQTAEEAPGVATMMSGLLASSENWASMESPPTSMAVRSVRNLQQPRHMWAAWLQP